MFVHSTRMISSVRLRAQLLTFGIEFQLIRSETHDETIKPPTIFDIKNFFTALSIALSTVRS